MINQRPFFLRPGWAACRERTRVRSDGTWMLLYREVHGRARTTLEEMIDRKQVLNDINLILSKPEAHINEIVK